MKGFEGLLGNPMFQAGMGILSANAPSLTPPNYMGGAMKGLMRGAQYAQQQKEMEMKKKLYDLQLQEAEDKRAREQQRLEALSGFHKPDPNAPQMLKSSAAQLYTTGNPMIDELMASGQTDLGFKLMELNKPEKGSALMQNFNFYRNKFPNKSDEEIAQMVKSGQTINVGKNGKWDNIPPSYAEVDKTFAKDIFIPYLAGGKADTEKNLIQLRLAKKALESGQNLTGPATALTPDFIKYFTNPEAINVREAVEEVAQRNLRQVLGGQFAMLEGAQLIKRAYNDGLPEDMNLQRVNRLISSIEQAAQAKENMISYFEENGSLWGYRGERPEDIIENLRSEFAAQEERYLSDKPEAESSDQSVESTSKPLNAKEKDELEILRKYKKKLEEKGIKI